jgi:hypothetical protein
VCKDLEESQLLEPISGARISQTNRVATIGAAETFWVQTTETLTSFHFLHYCLIAVCVRVNYTKRMKFIQVIQALSFRF